MLAAFGFATVGLLVGMLVWRLWPDEAPAVEPAASSTTTSGEVGVTDTIAEEDHLRVTTADDDGPGSLREAIAEANERARPTRIEFDAITFADPTVITIESPLPEIAGDVELDGYIPDRLWVATGITLSGANKFRVLTVAEGGKLRLRSLTVANGAADDGGGILNRGSLVMTGMTLLDNLAGDAGGAVANDGGDIIVINSTFTRNDAKRGGGMANLAGQARVINSTFSENSAERGGALFDEAQAVVSNTILANSSTGPDCVATAGFDPASTNNLIEQHDGCGDPISTDDPGLEQLDYYNGPIRTLPLRSGSPAVNLGNNDAALDEDGAPLVWDQRGNGDPRFVAGYTDIGAFEHQAFPDLTVDTPDDVVLRSCSAARVGDCPLRAAIELANVTPEPDVIIFDPRVFTGAVTLTVTDPLPQVTADLTLDASATGPVRITGSRLGASSGTDMRLVDVSAD